MSSDSSLSHYEALLNLEKSPKYFAQHRDRSLSVENWNVSSSAVVCQKWGVNRGFTDFRKLSNKNWSFSVNKGS